MDLMKRLMVEEEGQGLVEYALIIALISIVAIVAMGPLGTIIKEKFTDNRIIIFYQRKYKI